MGWFARNLVSCYYYNSTNLSKSRTLSLNLLETGLWYIDVSLQKGDYLFVFMEEGVKTTVSRVTLDGSEIETTIKTVKCRINEVLLRQSGPVSGNF